MMIEMISEVAEPFTARVQTFREKFGRDPGPRHPVPFDPEEDQPQFQAEERIAQEFDPQSSDMARAGASSAAHYAAPRTRHVVTQSNKPSLGRPETAAWHDALKEYRVLEAQATHLKERASR